ncbi:MAG: adenine deaminase [Desulfococcaceae bacterium]
MELSTLIECARGDRRADLVLKNGKILNVFNGEFISGHVAVCEDRIVGIGDYNGRREVDLEGRYVVPGFVDAHVHIESAMVSVSEFARSVLARGTTTVVADPHEIANVLGADGIRYMLDAARELPMDIRFSLSSCVPATEMETAGARLEAADLRPFLSDERIVALAEMMNFPGVVAAEPEVLDKIVDAVARGLPIDGHAPGLAGKELNAYLAAGVSTDHECTTAREALEKIAGGMAVMVREGTGARNLDALFPAITDETWHRMMWCTDDRHPADLLDEGGVDHIVRRAIEKGLDPSRALRMATINPARHFGLREVGAIAPGRRADLVIFGDLDAPFAEQVYCGGALAAENGRPADEISWPAAAEAPGAMNVSPETVSFEIPAEGPRVRCIGIVPDQIVTEHLALDAAIRDGKAVADPARDLLKIAVVERYSGKSRTGRAFVKGLGLRKGALASTVAHDSHNIVVAGADDGDMKAALSAVVRMGGGMVVVADGEVRAQLPLPIAGLMSPEPMETVRQKLDALIAAAHELGSTLHDPFMTLGFLALPVIPSLKLTDRGLVDVEGFARVGVFAG